MKTYKRPGKISFNVLEESIEVFKNHWQDFVSFTAIIGGGAIVAVLILMIPFFGAILATLESDVVPVFLFFTTYPFMIILNFAVLVILHGGTAKMTREILETGSTSWRSGLRALSFGQIMGLSLMMILTFLAGVVACFVGVFLMYGVTLFMVFGCVYHQMSPLESFKRGLDLVKDQFWMAVLFGFVITIIGQAGAMLCYVGLLATLPFAGIAIALSYRDVVGEVWGKAQTSSPTLYPRTEEGVMPDYNPEAVTGAPEVEGKEPHEGSTENNDAPDNESGQGDPK